MQVVSTDIGVEVHFGRLKVRQIGPVGSGNRQSQTAAIELLPNRFQTRCERSRLHVGILPPGEIVVARLVGDRHPADTLIPLHSYQVLDKFTDSLSPIRNRIRRAAEPLDGVFRIAGISVPGDVAPHLLEKDVHATAVSPIQDAIQHLHLGIAPVEDATPRLINALFKLDAAPIHAEPFRMFEQLLPVPVVARVRIATPTAP